MKVTSAKLHVAFGLKSLLAVAWTVTDEYVNDQTQFLPLLAQISRGYRIGRVLADAGYNAAAHFEAVDKLGGQAFLDFNKNACPCGSPHHDAQLFLYRNDPDAWLALYCMRSLSETGNSIFKRTVKRTHSGSDSHRA